MQKFVLIVILLLTCPAWGARAERAEKASEVFQPDRMLTIRIHMTGEQWRMMQPQRASRLATAMGVIQHPTTQQTLEAAGQMPPAKSASKATGDGEHRPPGLVGNEYAYIRAAVDVDGRSYSQVGVRFKGQWSYTLAGAAPRRPMKLNFDHFVPGQDFHGVKSLSLCTNAIDPSQLRESLGYALFRDAGLPAPRTCFALVYLTVEGLYRDELLGLYTVVEEVNKDFLYRHFGTTKGLLIRPERTRNLTYFGDRWEDYNRYNLQSPATPFTGKRFMDFTRLIHLSGDEDFGTEIGSFVDTDQFLRFLAANVLIINTDSLLVNGHNFYIHVHPKTGRLSFIPWDMHLAFGLNGQTMEEWTGLTIDHPYRVSNRLLERVLTIGWMRDAYRQYLREFATGCFAPAKMEARLVQLEQVVRKAEAIAQSQGKALPISPPGDSPRKRPELKPFIAARVQSVLEQLAGRIDGDPVNGRRPPPKATVIPVIKPVPAPAPAKAASIPAAAVVKAIAAAVLTPPKPVAPPPANVAPPKPQRALANSPTTRPAALKPALPTTQPAPAKPQRTPTTKPVARTWETRVILAAVIGADAPATTQPTKAKRPVATTLPATPKPQLVAKVAKAVPAPPPPPKVVKTVVAPKPLNPWALMLVNTLDVDRDGQLGAVEIDDATKHLFIVHGQLHAGPLDEQWLAATFDRIGSLLDAFPPPVDNTAPPQDPLRPRPALTWAKALMQRIDVNKTGHPTLEDLLAAAKTMFDQADLNHDGLLNTKEISLFMDQLSPRP